MSALDRTLCIGWGSFAGGCGLAALFADWFSVPAGWCLPLGAIALATGASVWSGFKNKQQDQLVELSRTLYYKNIINNRFVSELLLFV